MAEPSAADRRADFLSRLGGEESRQDEAASDRRAAEGDAQGAAVAELRRAAADLRAAAADLRAAATALRQLIAPDARPG